MTQRLSDDTLSRPVDEHMRTDFVSLESTLTVAEALDLIQQQQPSGRIVYFYCVGGDGRLLGVVPTRRLLLSAREKRLSEIMIEPVIVIPRNATVLDACEFFILHKLLAFPVVDENRRMIGLVDVELYTQELSDLDRRESQNHLFQLIGIQLESHQRSTPNLFRRRFPWLLATLVGGVLAAVVIDLFYGVASLPLVIPFIPLVLGLSSSVTAQSVSLALQTIRGQRPTLDSVLAQVKTEFNIGSLLGIGCGVAAGALVFAWKGNPVAVLNLAGSVAITVTCAALLGLAMPYVFRRFNHEPQVAAGPIALSLTDVVTLLIYFNISRVLVP